MTPNSFSHKQWYTVLLGIGAVAVLVAVVTYVKIDRYLVQSLDKKEQMLSELALLIDRNAPTENVASFIRDCSARDRFDSLLGNLGNLKLAELNEVLSLFDACAGYTTRVKQLSVFEFESTFEVYKELYAVEKMLRMYTGDRARVHSTWSELVELEKERSTYYEEQVAIQKEIISSLIAGEKNDSVRVTERVQRAEILGQSLGQVNATIDALRATVVVQN